MNVNTVAWQQWELKVCEYQHSDGSQWELARSVNVNTVVAAVKTTEVCECQYSGGSSGN